jgi:DUF438 domain-containing protein
MDTEITYIQLPTGQMTLEELELVLKLLPVEISVVGADDTVRFFSDKEAESRLFLRSKPALGRDLHVCHPKKYIGAMEQIINDFRSGKQSHARFWRQDHQGKFIVIEYYALRDNAGAYKGTLEVVQDITAYRQLEGDRHEVLYL